MMRKVIAMLLVFVMLCGMMPAGFATEVEEPSSPSSSESAASENPVDEEPVEDPASDEQDTGANAAVLKASPPDEDNDHTFTHLDVRIAGVTLTMTKKTINMVTGALVDSSNVTINASLTKVEYVTINGVTYSNFSKMDSREWRQSNVRIDLSALTDTSTAVLVVDLIDTNNKEYNDVVITYNRAGIQYAIEHCDGYKDNNGNPRYDGIDFDPSKGANNIVLIQYDDYVIPVLKVWNDAQNQDGIRPQEVTVNLYANGALKTSAVLNESNGWAHMFTGMPSVDESGSKITYTIDEAAVPDGYVKNVGDNGTYLTVTNTHTPETLDIKGTKTWQDANDQDGLRPESITINLLANGDVFKTVTVSAEDDWKWSFTALPKYAAGQEIKYSITEETVTGYTTEVNGYNVINSHTPEEVDIAGVKTWDDGNDQDGIRPESVTIHLLANGEKIDSATVTAEDGWKYSFENLPKYAEGEEISYTLQEEAVAGYTPVYDGYNVTNKHTPSRITVAGAKTWNDANDQDGIRPDSITVRLLADGEEVASKVVTAEDGWKWSFADLPEFKDGKKIEYTIEEDAVTNYTVTVDGYNVTNTHIPEKINISGSKTWDDGDNQDGIRPESITIHLLANGEKIETVTVTAEDDWKWSFTDLPKYANGEEIVYTITEEAVDGYETIVKDFDVTNSHTPSRITVAGAKTWNDGDDQDGIRPDSITVRLLADGEEVASKVVTAEDGWKWSFSNLPEFKAGVRIVYTVTEDPVDGYETAVEGYNVTNTHTPETTDIEGAKTWDDNDDQDGKRPESITVNLLANGEKVASQTVTAGDGWKWSFTDLPKFAAGQEIKYEISEEAVEGYTAEVDGYNVTNVHIPETVAVEGGKTWNDANDQDGKRPRSITIYLLANGEKVAAAKVTAEDEWKWSFTDLPKYAAGQEIKYEISEEAVEDYTAEVNGYNVTNTHIPETVTIEGGKTWQDNDDQDGIRPESITVNLLSDGEKVASRTVTADDDWKWTFADLPKYADGKRITYTIEELEVEGYTTTVVGYNVINVHIPETVTVSGTKTWNDGNDQDGIRPDSITVNLLANGVKVDSVEVKASLFGNWKYTFRNLPKYEKGVEIVYTVTEEAVEGYTAKVEGFDITNTHETEKTELNVKKVWDDKNDENKKRPTSVKITLYANGKSTGQTMVLSASNNWAGTFKNLEKNEGGKAIKYTVKEETVNSYKATYSYSGNTATVTNTFSVIPVTGDVSGLPGHILLMGISAAAILVLGIIGKRRFLF